MTMISKVTMGDGCNSHTLLEEYVPQVSNVFETTKYLQFYSFLL